MSTDTLIAGFAAFVALCAAYFSWVTATKSNQLSKINALVALRQHYFDMFRQEAEFIERYRGQPSAVKSAGESAAIMADRLREIDSKLADQYGRVIRSTRA